MLPSGRNNSVVDAASLTHDDLLDVYKKLERKYGELKDQNENLNQKVHQEMSQKKVLENTLNDVQSELDSINDNHTESLQQLQKRNDELKNKNHVLIEKISELEGTIDELTATVDKLTSDLKETRGFLAVKAIKPRVSDTYAKSLELENDHLRATINNIKEEMQDMSTKHTESVAKIQELSESLECVKDNLETKKIELDEKTETLDHLNEKIHELSSELALIRNSSGLDDNSRKGNSLFAEVDDQRQKMKSILKGERAHYMDMKKAYNSKEMEIRRLKRENLNIKSEIQACSNQLQRGEQMSSSHKQIYINHLESEKLSLENQLKKMEERLIDLARDQKMHWVETVLTASSKESRDLKDRHYVLLREKTILADNHSKALKDLAKARLDAIKLKALLGRIVDEFKLDIDESQFSDIGIDECVFENLRVDNFEKVDLMDVAEKPDEQSSSEMLNESTIILLGGRERLGNAIADNKIVKSSSFDGTMMFEFEKAAEEAVDCKENIFDEIEEKPTIPVENEASIKLELPKSSAIRHVKSEDQLKRKPAFTLKRIVIPTKKSKPT